MIINVGNAVATEEQLVILIDVILVEELTINLVFVALDLHIVLVVLAVVFLLIDRAPSALDPTGILLREILSFLKALSSQVNRSDVDLLLKAGKPLEIRYIISSFLIHYCIARLVELPDDF